MSNKHANINLMESIVEDFGNISISFVLGMDGMVPHYFSNISRDEAIILLRHVLKNIETQEVVTSATADVPEKSEPLPETLIEAVDYYIRRLEPKEMADAVVKMNESTFFASLHDTLGQHIRNELGFWKKNTVIYRYMVEAEGCKTPDDMSEIIIRNIYRKLKNAQ